MSAKGITYGYDECISLIDFLNDRLRVFKSPWYTWGIRITWTKLRRWGVRLGWRPPGLADTVKLEIALPGVLGAGEVVYTLPTGVTTANYYDPKTPNST